LSFPEKIDLPFPVAGTELNAANSMLLDFSINNSTLNNINISDEKDFCHYVFNTLKKNGKKFGIGGYLEERIIYRADLYHNNTHPRNTHLGVDIWCEETLLIHAPLEGTIFGFADNAGDGNYGPTVILEHKNENFIFYSLYGHLSKQSIMNYETGQKILKGDMLGKLGNYKENGNWPPHLHFQIITDMLGNTSDFPGVCSRNEISFYKEICPNPNLILKCDLLQ
jgi:peptidoglycan LD-endopeptidase LytH